MSRFNGRSSRLKAVILVGGSSLLPEIPLMLQKTLGAWGANRIQIVRSDQPQTAVALGAVLWGHRQQAADVWAGWRPQSPGQHNSPIDIAWLRAESPVGAWVSERGTRLCVATERQWLELNLPEMNVRRQLELSPVSAISFDALSGWAMFASGGKLLAMNVLQSTSPADIEGLRAEACCVALDFNGGRFLIGDQAGSIYYWEPDLEEAELIWEGQEEALVALAGDRREGVLYAATARNLVKLKRDTGGYSSIQRTEIQGGIRCLAIKLNDEMVACGVNSGKVYEVDAQGSALELASWKHSVRVLCFSPKGTKLAAITGDRIVVTGAAKQARFSPSVTGLEHCAWKDEDNLFLLDSESSVSCWQLAEAPTSKVPLSRPKIVEAVIDPRSGSIATLSRGPTRTFLHNVKLGFGAVLPLNQTSEVSVIAYSSDSEHIICAGPGMEFLSTSTGCRSESSYERRSQKKEQIRYWETGFPFVGSEARELLAETNGDLIVSATPDGLKYWSGFPLVSYGYLDRDLKRAELLAFCGQTSDLLVADANSLLLWSMALNKRVDFDHSHNHAIRGLGVSLDGSLAGTCDGEEVFVWDVIQRRRILRTEANGARTVCIWEERGVASVLAAVGQDVLVLNTSTGEIEDRLRTSHGAEINKILVDSIHRVVAILFADGVLRIARSLHGPALFLRMTSKGTPLWTAQDEEFGGDVPKDRYSRTKVLAFGGGSEAVAEIRMSTIARIREDSVSSLYDPRILDRLLVRADGAAAP
jgi:WD40 repeat protein